MTDAASMQPVLIAGRWRDAGGAACFRRSDPQTGELLPDRVSGQHVGGLRCGAGAAAPRRRDAARLVRRAAGGSSSRRLPSALKSGADELVACAHAETGLPAAAATARCRAARAPRTSCARRRRRRATDRGGWPPSTRRRISAAGWRPVGPVVVFGPNNFPFAFGSVSGGDFAAAIAAGNPVIGKANSSHPATTRLFAEEAHAAVEQTGLPAGTVQLIYRIAHADGDRLVADPRLGATGYTGSRPAGLALKAAADRAGKPIYLELSSVNPVVILPGALATRADQIVEEFTTSCLLGTGQFCTNPGLVLLMGGPRSDAFVAAVVERFAAAPVGPLLSSSVQRSLQESIRQLIAPGRSG